MRFGIHELLVATTLAAIYSAGFAFAFRVGGGLSARELVPMMVACLLTCSPAAMIAWRSWRGAGEPMVEWLSSDWWHLHAMFLGVFLGYVGFYAWTGGRFGLITLVLQSGLHALFLPHGRITVNRRGMSFGLALLPWTDCDLRLDEEATHAEFSMHGQLFPPRWPVHAKQIAVPAEKREALLALLASVESITAERGTE